MIRLLVLLPLLATRPVPSTPAEPQVLRGVSLSREAGGVVLTLPGVTAPRVFDIEDPHRLVVDVPAMSLLPRAPALMTVPVGRWGVRQVRTSQPDSDPEAPCTRIVLDLEGPSRWRLEQGPAAIRVVIERPGREPGDSVVLGALPALANEPTADAPPANAPPASALAAIGSTGARADTVIVDERADTVITVDPSSDEIVRRRQDALWDRRALALLTRAVLGHEAKDYRASLESLSHIFRLYPATEVAAQAHLLAARIFCELHLGEEAIAHVAAVVADTTAPGFLVTESLTALSECPLRPDSWTRVENVLTRATARLSDGAALRRLGGHLGILMADAGAEPNRALKLLGAALVGESEAQHAAALHRAIGLCHEQDDQFTRAAREFLFAARLLFGRDREAAIALRVRAADALYRTGQIDAAVQHYRLVAGLEELPEALSAWTTFQLGNCYYRTRRFAKAAEVYGELKQKHATSFWSTQAESRLAVMTATGAIR